jgi:hypothetical protein
MLAAPPQRGPSKVRWELTAKPKLAVAFTHFFRVHSTNQALTSDGVCLAKATRLTPHELAKNAHENALLFAQHNPQAQLNVTINLKSCFIRIKKLEGGGRRERRSPKHVSVTVQNA